MVRLNRAIFASGNAELWRLENFSRTTVSELIPKDQYILPELGKCKKNFGLNEFASQAQLQNNSRPIEPQSFVPGPS